MTLLWLGEHRFVGGGEAGPRTGAPVGDAHHDVGCQLRTDPPPSTQHPASNSGSGKLTDSSLLAGGLRNSLSLNSSHWDNKLSKINDNWHI